MSLFHPSTWLHPLTRKRLDRFRKLRRAWWSFWLLAILYGVSLMAEWVCNDKPLYIRFNDRSYFPIFKFYPEDTFTGNGRMTRPDYKKLAAGPLFAPGTGNRMVFPVLPNGPLEILTPDQIEVPDVVTVEITREPLVGSIDIDPEGQIVRQVNAGVFFDVPNDAVIGKNIKDRFELPPGLQEAFTTRFGNQPAVAADYPIRDSEKGEYSASLSAFSARSQPPKTVRLTLREKEKSSRLSKLVFTRDVRVLRGDESLLRKFAPADQETILDGVRRRFAGVAGDMRLTIGHAFYRIRFDREDVRFPFRPVRGHPLGIDSAGRDVLARLLYGLRTSMTFGLLLVLAALAMGTLIGAVQGYYGGLVDLVGQRTIEIWESLPFLYVLILLGSIYGQSFILLLAVYGIFNWIGISFYMRAEFLRLRKLPFVEAARCMGLSSRKIIVRHILPNALAPLITFFPFSLVGAIGSLAALDYLGFGLPPPTPSWGEMLSQAQEYGWAWWLVLYPSLALFVVMLLGVFVGEGVRSAFDPRSFTRME